MNISAVVLPLVVFASALPARADELQQLATDFWGWRAAHQPVSRDDIQRLDQPDGRAPDWSRTAVAGRRADLSAFEERWKRIDASGMPVAWQVDRRLVASALARVRWELDVERGWERNALFYVDQSLGAVYDRLLPPPPFSRARSLEILHRLQNVPGLLASGKANLEGHAAAPFARVAIEELGDVGARVSAAIRALTPILAPEAGRQIDAAAARAIEALEDYRRWLEVRVGTMRVQTAVGQQAYLFFLRKVALLPYTTDEMLAMGRQEWARAVALQSYEEAKNVGLPDPALFADEAAQIAREERDEAAVRRFLEEKNLLTVPRSLRRYRNLKLPAYVAPLAFLGVTDDLTSPSRLTEDATSYIRKPSADLGFFGLSMARDPRPILVHEGIPGHFFQLALSWSHEDPIRRHYYDSAANEGIGFYAEEMMLSAGYFDDSPKTRETIAAYMRLRALRVEADVQLALGLFTVEQAAEYLEKTVPMDHGTARQEVIFFASAPGQAISYQIGKLQIVRLLAEARRAQGGKFSLRAFHDFVWKNGNVPLSLQRFELLGSNDEIEALDVAPGRAPGR
jgi:uncharacterized protein (DUF885 family)